MMATCPTCGAYGLTEEPQPSEADQVLALLSRLLPPSLGIELHIRRDSDGRWHMYRSEFSDT